MRPTRLVLGASLASLSLVAAAPQPAAACGGCFSPPMEVTSVDSHRMVISLSAERTTLWDQIRYTGDPADFVWVLPVPSGAATVELADSKFFDDLELQTSPRVYAPPIQPPDCPPPPDNWGGAGAQDASAAAPDAGGVDIYHEEVVGPYETMTIGSDSPTALRDWLVAHGYNVPDETLPTIGYYVGLGSVFVVLRLAPTAGVDAMQPIRVRYPGYMATFPLKMVTVGATGTLGLTLWVISDQRYGVANYGSAPIDVNRLVWDFAAFRSNYDEVFDAQIEELGGAGWIVENAVPLDWIWFEDDADPSVARVGLRYPYMTRLRTRALVDNLGSDLELAPSADVGDVYRDVYLTQGINWPAPPQCPDWNGDGQPDTWDDYGDDDEPVLSFGGCQVGGRSGAAVSGLALVALGGALIARRRRRS